MQAETNHHWHALTGDEALRRLEAVPGGLAAEEAARRRAGTGRTRCRRPSRCIRCCASSRSSTTR